MVELVNDLHVKLVTSGIVCMEVDWTEELSSFWNCDSRSGEYLEKRGCFFLLACFSGVITPLTSFSNAWDCLTQS